MIDDDTDELYGRAWDAGYAQALADVASAVRDLEDEDEDEDDRRAPRG